MSRSVRLEVYEVVVESQRDDSGNKHEEVESLWSSVKKFIWVIYPARLQVPCGVGRE